MAGDPEGAVVFEDGVQSAGAEVIALVAQDDAAGRG
jgi:chloramphenicol 3-O-phosphotransferase